ncbi:MAG: biotin synthase BioB [Legionellaceae bacterium]|nr:biotin synthase BioB [Legionellaceae bacterium]
MTSKFKRWTMEDVAAIYSQPFNNLLYEAHCIHRQNHDPNKMQLAKLLSIKTGACPEDCGYCSQSGHHDTSLVKEKLMSVEDVVVKAQQAKDEGATRFCMGAGWRCPPDKSMHELADMIKSVKDMGLQTCMTLGMLTASQANELKEAGLDYYNHNIDTSPSYYDKVTSTRCFSDRLNTIENVRQAGINVCCGGIVGIGESKDDRIEFLLTLANLETPPESVPINRLIPVEGTPLAKSKPVEGIELVRTIATARILMPTSAVRLTAGRTEMSDELQSLAFFAGANSIFIGDTLLTEANPQMEKDSILLDKLGMQAEQYA